MTIGFSRSATTRVQATLAVVLVVAALAAGAFAYLSLSIQPGERLIVSTTTSLFETGCLDALKTKFESRYPYLNVSFISQGTGLAIQTAMRGDADMILVHDTARETQFLQGGYGVNRKIVAYNYFLIVGPEDDPASIGGKSPSDALKTILAAGRDGKIVWISRGDDSGTHAKEKRLWSEIGEDAARLRTEQWYLEAGGSMTTALKMANEKRGYTLSDIGTYSVNLGSKNIDLVKFVEAGKSMLNVYSAIANDPRNSNMTKSNFQGSMQFIRFLVSDEGQDLFTVFGVDKYGFPLFSSYIRLLRTQSDPQAISWIQELAFIDGIECPKQFQYQADTLYSTQIPEVLVLTLQKVSMIDRKIAPCIQSSRA